MATFRPKKLLLIFEINELMIYLRNKKDTELNSNIKINYQETYKNYDISFRPNRVALFNSIFDFHAR
jgi:hypothetical protein